MCPHKKLWGHILLSGQASETDTNENDLNSQ